MKDHLFDKLCARVVSPQTVIVRKIAENFSLFADHLNVDESFITNDVSRVSLSCFFCASFWCDCGVVMYHKSQRATIYSPQNSLKTRTNHFLAHIITTKPFTFSSAHNALYCHPTHPHQLGMGGDVGWPPPEHPEQLVAGL